MPILSVSATAENASDSPVPLVDPVSLVSRIDDVLRSNLENRTLSTDQQSAWQILHGILAYGRDLQIRTGETETSAIDYVLRGGAIRGFQLRSGDRFNTQSKTDDQILTRGIRADLEPVDKIGQGHRDQWLAYMSACELPRDQIIQTIDGPRRLDLWLRQIQWDVPLNFEQEFSWTLMSLVPYLSTSEQWTARDGNTYSIESLLRTEIDRLSAEDACGGSHRLTAIAITLRKHQDEGGAMTGAWTDAQELVEGAILQAIEYQNADGSLSSHYFARPGWSLDLVTAIGSTGHVLEFIAVAAPDELLIEPPVLSAANHLCELLEQAEPLDLECGALYHAISGLQIFRKRLLAIIASS